MSIWFTSDTHFYHKRIIELSYRPFDTVEEMNSTIIDNINAAVEPDDVLFMLGDIVMGGWEQNIPIVDRINCKKVLVVGNHDKPFTVKSEQRMAEVMEVYERHFDSVVHGSMALGDFVLSHFPYDGDHTDEERFASRRPKDDGKVLIHGHIHEPDVVSYSNNGTLQIHIGVDAHDYAPVSLETVAQIVEEEIDD